MKTAHFLRNSLLFILPASYLAAQPTCPTLNFLSTPRIVAAPKQTVFTTRQSDGTFTGYYGPMLAPFLYATPIPNFSQTITSCFPGPTGKGSAPFSSYARAGWASHIGDAADLDGDGIEDAVLIAWGATRRVYVVLMAASGVPKMTQNVALPTAASAISVRVVDVNKDGKPDLIVSTGIDPQTGAPGTLYVKLNDGSGTFNVPAKAVGAGSNPQGFAVVDLAGNGYPDVIVADQGDTTGSGAGVAVLINDGTGAFSAPSILSTTPAAAKAVVVGDFNGDKIPDIAAATGSTISIFPGQRTNGLVTFSQGTRVTFPSGGDSAYLAMGDFNGDGKLDLVSSNFYEQTAAVLLNNGSGATISFAPQVSYPISLGQSPDYLLVTDFNNDGIPDIIGGLGSPTAPQLAIAGNSNNVIDVLLGNGDGTFAPFTGSSITQVSSTNPITFAVSADVNGDGKPDVLAMAQGSTNLLYYAGRGNGTFAAPVTTALGSTFANAITAIPTDLNGDGVPDLVILTNAGFVVALGQKSGTFQPLNTSPYKSSIALGGLAMADFNGDGKPDVATAICSTSGGPTSVHIYNGNGSGGFTDSQPIQLNYCPDSLYPSDLNGDKKPDIVSLNNAATPSSADVILNQGNGSWAAPKTYPLDPNGRAALALVDVNGDGSPDLVAASNLNRPFAITTLLNSGTGTFGQPVSTQIPIPVQTLAGADLNGDKKADLIISLNPVFAINGYYAELLFAQGNGDGTFQALGHITGPDTNSLQLVDFNGDGRPDILATSVNYASPTIKTVTNAPSGYFITILSGAPSVAPPPPPSLSMVNGASFTAGAPVAAESIASAFASHLAVASNPGGTTVAVKDSAGTNRPATVFYANTGQVNFEVPAGTVNGTASVTVTADDGTTTSGTVQIVNVAPGMFPANAAGLYAGSVLSVGPDGTQTPLNNYQLDSNQNVIPLPVNVAPPNQVFLILYGTGIRHAASVTATIGGINVPVAFAGPQGAFVGEDQVNLGPLPASLGATGVAKIVITADGQVANTVTVTIQ